MKRQEGGEDTYQSISGFKGASIPADEWFERQRAFPFDEIPVAEYHKALRYVHTRMALVSDQQSGLSWTLAGPTNIEGRITTIAINPTNPLVVFAGSANGGVWKSTNFCQTWRSVFDNQNTASIGALAIDPANPDVIYCGTGEANSLRSYYPGTGLYKSTDAGISWTVLGLEQTFSIANIAINPLDTQELFVAAAGSLRRKTTERGIYKSTDGGTTWSQSLFVADSIGAIDVVLDPSNPGKVFAAMWERQRREDYVKYGGPGSALYVSTNSGASWDVVNGGFPSNQATLGRISLDVCALAPSVLYALTAHTNGTNRGLYKSTDGGANWAFINASVGSSSSYAWFNRICKVNPVNEYQVFCGGIGMAMSANGGTSFSTIPASHVDQHAVAFAPSNAVYIVIGNDGGIDFSTNGGATWNASTSLPITQFYAGEINPANPDDILGGTQDNGTVRSASGGLNTWQDMYGGDGFYCLIDYTDPTKVYASSQYGGLGRSTDGGVLFSTGTTGLDLSFTNWMTPFVMDKNNPLVLYCGTYRMHRSTNGMQSWTPISGDLANGHVEFFGSITTVDVAKSNPSVIYCGTDDANVWRTTNGGSGWTKINNGLPTRWVTRVAVDPDSANVCYVALSGYKIDTTGSHIYRTTNYGSTWTSIRGNLPDAPINDVIIDPLDTRTLYIATDVGVLYSSDIGGTWQVLGAGLPMSAPCHDLTLHAASRKLVVWTHGRSAFATMLPPPNSMDETLPPYPRVVCLFQNYPNPFNLKTVINYQQAMSGRVELKVFDVLGHEVAVLLDEVKEPGEYSVSFDASSLASGMYLYRLTAGGFIQTRKMVLMR